MKQKSEFVPLNTALIDIKSFDCGKKPITAYLKRYAAKNMEMGLSSTFVLPYRAANTLDNAKANVAAFYTLANQSIVPDSIPTKLNLPRYPTPVVLVAQLGVHSLFHGQGIGTKTLITALLHAYDISNNPNGIPSLGVVLDALDDDALRFYQSFDFFISFPGDAKRLFVPMVSIAQLVDRSV